MTEYQALPSPLPSDQAVRFGPYRILPRQRLVLEAERPLRLGRRAVDILLILLEQAGQVVSKQELMARVWPSSVVEDSNLRVHMAALRKALGDGQAGQRYIVTVAQRGYSFVAPLCHDALPGPALQPDGLGNGHNLPLRRTRLIGRQGLIDSLVRQLPQQRFITLTGTGGIGKTSVALRVAELLIGHYRDGIFLLDLAPLDDPALILPNLAALLGLPVADLDALGDIARALRERQLLLLIDNCEHLLEAIAPISEQLLRSAPHLHILATSRESLRAEGEVVQRLDSLACPPSEQPLARSEVLAYPALQLLIERAISDQDNVDADRAEPRRFELNDTELALAIELCQRLDGIPLALELAAAQIGRLGLPTLLAQLHDSFRPLTQGRHGCLPRQQTLRATLDWSFALLIRDEQCCLRRLAVFRGGFTLASAVAVIGAAPWVGDGVLAAITQLVAKSLLNVEVGDDEVSYRLLDTTRRYALEHLEAAGELFASRERHAERCLALMQQAQHDWELIPTQAWLERYAPHREDIRAALDWGLGPTGPHALAIHLTASAMPLWQELSLLREHGGYVQQALALLQASSTPCPQLSISLQLALGSFSYHTQGGTASTIAAFVSARQLAETHQDLAGQLRAVSGHMAVNLCCGHYPQALEQSRHFDRLEPGSDPLLALSAQRLRVLAQHFAGDQTQARQNAEQVLQRLAQSGQRNRFTHGFGVQYDQSVASLTILARILWLQGFPEQAWRTASQALEIALQINHGTSICYTLALSGCVIAQYNGDLATTRQLLDLLLQQAQKHSVLLFQSWARHYVRALDAEPLEPMPDAEGLIKDIVLTLRPEGLDAELLARAESGAAGWSAPEILRARAAALLREPGPQPAASAEAVLLKALDLARQQGALAWELRSASALARLWQRQGRYQQARDLLAPVYERFTEGFATPDLVQVRSLLDELQGQVAA
jgi:predicted ATPase/DNA-binding winged helix-turn-helix (wHTH) protein